VKFLRILFYLFLFVIASATFYFYKNHFLALEFQNEKYTIEVLKQEDLVLNDQSKDESQSTTAIPKNIFMFWHDKKLPPKMDENVKNIKTLHPDFNIYIFDEQEAAEFIENNFIPDVLNAYNSLIPKAFKADLWRYCVLYKFGGIYQDIKLMPKGDLTYHELLSDNFYVRDRNNYDIWNAFIISKPRNSILKKSINKIVQNVKIKFYGRKDLEVTGPALLRSFFSDEELQKAKASLSKIDGFIYFKNRVLLEEYKEYRQEYKNAGEKRYGALWKERKIYQ
jgi:mannosyltransferase OCH1-like enzyme